MSSGAVIARIISQYSDKGSKAAQKDIARTAKTIDAFNKKIVKSYAIAGAAVAAFGIKLAKDAVQGAMEDQKQQAALAIALRNTAGATDAAIAANVKYLDSLELQVAIDNEQLIPALQKLVTATGNLGEAQALLSLATDVSAASGKDLASVSTALSRAVGGNFTALKKLGLPLDENAIKTGNLKKLLEDLAKVSAGQAAAAANTFEGKMEKLRLTIAQTADKVGYALIPVIEEYATYIISDIIPAIDKWVEANEGKLAKSFEGLLNTVAGITTNLVKLIVFIEKYKEIALIIASIPLFASVITQLRIVYGFYVRIMPLVNALFSMKTIAAVATYGKLLGEVAKVFKVGGLIAGFRSLITLLSMVSPHVKAVTLLSIGLTALVVGLNKLIFGTDKAAQKTKVTAKQAAEMQQKAILNGFKSIEIATEAAKAEKARTLATLKNLEAQKKADAAARKRAKFEADYAKLNNTLAKRAGVQLLSSEDAQLVQINAAIALAGRQKEVNKLDKERLERMKDEILSLKVRNDLAKRYQDILQALSDDKIDTKEIAILAKLWEVPIEAVEAYLATLFAVEDATITDDEIVNLAMKWGSTQEQAARYLDFFTYLNDGFLSDAEIEKLKTKWKMTEDQVRMYADFVGIVNDGKLTDAEIVKIQGKWKLTTDQVVDYIKQIGSPVSYSDTLIDPAKAAEIGWKDATAALAAYLALLGKANSTTVTTTPSTTITTPGGTVNTTTIEGINKASGYSDSSLAAANAYAVAKAAGDATGAALAAAGVNPSTLASAESGAIGAASIAAQLRAAEIAVANSATLAQFQAKEAQDLAASVAKINNSNYDERFRFNRGTVATASGMNGGNLMAGGSTNITVNVSGSVTSEQDLVTTIRNGLLTSQSNGNSITLQAI